MSLGNDKVDADTLVNFAAAHRFGGKCFVEVETINKLCFLLSFQQGYKNCIHNIS